jgi:FkbM family methyltransferase
MKIYDFIKENFSEDSVIFEIGCHFGRDTLKISEFTGSKNMHVFEPDPRNIKYLRDRGIDKICKFNPVAVSDKKGKSIFHLSSGEPFGNFDDKELIQNGWSLSNSLKKPIDHLSMHPWCKFENSIEVDTVSVDGYVMENDIELIDFIWMDVQGAEDLVFSGMTESRNFTRFIYTEYCEDGIELYESSPNKEKILDILGPDWEILHDFGNTGSGIDFLLVNKKYKKQ